MRRETTKHGPRLDEALERETQSLEQGASIEARVEEWKEQESPGEAERDVDARRAPPVSLGGDAAREDAAHDPFADAGR